MFEQKKKIFQFQNSSFLINKQILNRVDRYGRSNKQHPLLFKYISSNKTVPYQSFDSLAPKPAEIEQTEKRNLQQSLMFLIFLLESSQHKRNLNTKVVKAAAVYWLLFAQLFCVVYTFLHFFFRSCLLEYPFTAEIYPDFGSRDAFPKKKYNKDTQASYVLNFIP